MRAAGGIFLVPGAETLKVLALCPDGILQAAESNGNTRVRLPYNCFRCFAFVTGLA